MRARLILFLVLSCSAALIWQRWELLKTDPQAEVNAPAPAITMRPLEDLPPAVLQSVLARQAAQRMTAVPTNVTALDAFNAWTLRFLNARPLERVTMIMEGKTLAAARRAELKNMIAADPRAALQNAMPPVVRQQLPLELAQLLEERVNEKAYFGVFGMLPANGVPTTAYRREVRTQDGGVYEAHVFGDRLVQQTTREMSVVGIAVDDVMVVEERPLRVMEAGEIPNHPNNLTRTRTLKPLDARGFAQDLIVSESPAPSRSVVETCPVSGQSTPAPKTSPGIFSAIRPNEPVVEAGGQVHYLCSGGHIRVFEDGILMQEGGNGGPITVLNAPTPTKSTGHRTNLLMRVAFPESMKPSITETEGYELGKNVQDWMLDVSSGRMTFATTVTPVIVLPRTEAWYIARDTNGGAQDVLYDARAAAKLAGFDTANYDFDAVIYSGVPGSFGGQAALGAKDCWLKSGTGVGVACHEYGHNFGLMHANYWSTANGSTIGGGTHIEYGDFFDTMGNAVAGDYQFNACHKNILNWLPLVHTHEVITSGTYRIHQVDQPAQDTHLRYALKIRKDTARSYWVEYRQKFLSNIGIQNGVLLHWSPWQSSAGGSHLLDATPGSVSGFNDAALMIGRTFSDLESDLHLTPIMKNTTVPPSMDVVVNMGPFPGNTGPSLAVNASALSVATATNVTFTASAVDGENDALSYAWDFDRDSSGNALLGTTNAAAVTYQWATAGLYRVRCVVSDMKGKTASASVVVQVGSPAMHRISGTITANGQPLADVLVSNGGSGSTYRDARSDSDGTYTLSVPAGSFTLSARGYGYTFAPTVLSVTGNVTGVNFTATELPRISITALDANATEGGDTATFRITRTGSNVSALTVRLFGARGTAIKSTDYTLSPATTTSGNFLYLDIPTNQSHLDVIVTALTDSTQESYETATLELGPLTSYSIVNAAATVTIADADSALPLVTLSVADRDANESGDTALLTVQRLGSTTAALDVPIEITGTATNGVDFTTIPSVITIPINAESITVPITPIQDTQAEPLETITISAANDPAYVRPTLIASYTSTLYLADDDAPRVTVAATDSAAAEAGNDPGIFTLTRTGDLSQPLNVLYGLTGSALHGVDYGMLTGDVTFAAGSRAATVVITPVNDAIGEPAQTVVLQIRSGSAYDAGTPSNATVTITDNGDVPNVIINVLAGPAVESGTAGTFRVTTTGTGAGNITVNYAVSGTATNGTDYTSLTGALVMAKNATATLTLTPIQDALNEGTETVTLTLTPDASYTLAVDTAATMNLHDDELPQISISGPNNTWTESPGAGLGYYFSRTGATTSALTVNFTLAGTATVGIDYTSASSSVIIPAGSKGAYASIFMLGDSLAEGTETVILNLAPGAGYSFGTASATGYIYDAQSAATTRVLSFANATSSNVEGAGTVLVPVTLDAPSASTVTVNYDVTGGTALGSGIDFAMSSGVLTFAPGDTLKNIPVNVLDDSVDEADETVIITLAPPSNAHLGTASHTFTITDNDAPVPVTIGFASATSSVAEDGVSATLPVALSAVQSSSVTVNYAVTGGTATNGTDYTLTSGTLTFALGETMQLIPNTITDDLPVDLNETVLLTLSSPTVATLNANAAHTLTIIDNDTVTLTIAATDASAAEPTDTGTFTITRTGSTVAAVTVNLTRTGSATNATDYSSIATTATIAANQTQTTITVTPLDDLTREGNETVTLTLATGSYTIASPSSATVTIVDDEPLLSITATDANADEAGDAGAFTISRAGPITSSLSVNVTISGTATSGGDYSSITVPVVIAANSATAVINVTPLNDSTPEPSETVIATLNAGPYGISGLSAATVTITDDEPFLSVIASDASAREGVDPGAFTITRTGSITSSLAVNVTLTGSATNGADYATITSPVTIPALQNSVSVPIITINDSAQEGYETAMLTLTTSAAYTLTSSITASVTIQDDDINNPPDITVTSPTNRNIALTNITYGLMIEASVIDDVSATSAWSVVSSPSGSTITFENNIAPTTGVRFSAVGTYLLRLTADDGSLQTTHDLHVSIGSAISGALTAGDVGVFDVGSAAGSYSINGSAVALSGSGTGLTNDNTDGFYFLRQPSSGTALEVIVRVDSITGGAANNGRAGIMFRDATGNADVMAFIGLTNNGQLNWTRRLTSGASANVTNVNSISAPRYLRLVRSGTSFTGSHSTDGITWTSQFSATITASSTMLVGLAVTSASTSALSAAFTNVSLPLNDNRGPLPNAGVDRAARINTAVSLAGSKTDDAKPVIPGLVTTQWIKLSGPGTATLTDTGAATTNASFNLSGIYIMRLIANDGEVKTYDEMTATITEDLINITITPGYEVANESGQVPVFIEITRPSPSGDLFLPVAMGGTATPRTDFEWGPVSQLYLQAGETFAAGELAPYIDNLVEGTETASITLLPGAGYTVGVNNSITWTILDAPVVTLTATTPVAKENGPTNGTITFTRTGSTAAALDIPITTSGTAATGIDYLTPASLVTIPIGSTSATLDLTPISDFFTEPEETITLTASGALIFGTAGPASITLRDSVIVTAVTQSNAAESGGLPGSFILTRIGSTDDALPVSIQLSGTVTNGADISAVSLNQIIPIGETTLTLPITPLADTVSEGEEMLTLTLLPTDDYQPGAPAAADLLITDRHLGSWKQSKFGVNANNVLFASDDADPDHDGFRNLFEYALGLDPLIPDTSGTGLVIDTVTLSNQRHLRATVTRDPAAIDVLLQVEVSTAVSSGWTTTGTVIDTNTTTQLSVHDATPVGSVPRRFTRVQATLAP